MKRLLFAAILLAPGSAFAGDDGSQPLNPLDPVRVVSPISIVQGDGIKVGEGTSLYPQAGLEMGYVSNVFYTHDKVVGAGLLRGIVEVGAGSLSPQRRQRTAGVTEDNPEGTQDVAEQTATEAGNGGLLQYSANLYATWDQYLSGNDKVTAQGGLGAGAYIRAIVNPGHPLNLFGIETFDRVLRAANFESTTDTDRDINTLNLTLNYQPTGRSLSAALIYNNTIDVFEQDQFQFSDRTLNNLALRVNWRLLPLTVAYLTAAEGYNTGIGASSVKVNSYPLFLGGGLNTALTAKLALVGHIGYTNGFYQSGPSYSTVAGGLYLDYKYSPLGRVRLLYDYEHADSINANFYRDHVFQAWLEQRFVPFSLFVSPELRLRQYQGVIGGGTTDSTRNDVILAATAGLRYDLRDWMVVTAEYRLMIDSTDFRYPMAGGPAGDLSYVRHEVLAGLRLAY